MYIKSNRGCFKTVQRHWTSLRFSMYYRFCTCTRMWKQSCVSLHWWSIWLIWGQLSGSFTATLKPLCWHQVSSKAATSSFSAAWTTVSSPTGNGACDSKWRWKQPLFRHCLKLIGTMIACSQNAEGKHKQETTSWMKVKREKRWNCVRWIQSWLTLSGSLLADERRNHLPLKCFSTLS